MDFLGLVDRNWPLLRHVAAAHVTAYRASNGLIGHRFFPGTPPMLLLEHVGARSGIHRTTPLVYFRDGDDIVIVASKGGYPNHPAWYHNLRANPDTVIQVAGERRRVRAGVADDAEHERLWPMAVRTYSGYRTYQRRTGRKIPLVILRRI
ncbi:nitroreductase family deazaflavin-dependent oxidoreductase [Pseudonocardia acaciae]|uniref:nitroreductase family deazaflavin-dependent oxidoreductase n=1 Tax=Pseudonocardia acaciae TaxID=551276 RepID=UPI00048ABD40|nr:nitroreductase family deazaflavin-dependent oxidoreductase [Pseudonocardia acaciae]